MIKYSAIKFNMPNVEYPIIMTGRRHSDILKQMNSMGLDYDKVTSVQGF